MSKMSLSVERAAQPIRLSAMGSLATITEATRMLAESKTLDDVRTIRDLAEAARVYAKQHKLGIEAQNHAGTIAVEADIRRGEILAEMAAAGERSDGGRTGAKTVLVPKLADLNTTKRESSDAQALATAASEVRSWMTTAREVTPRRAARVAREAKAQAQRSAKAAVATLPTSCVIRLGDFRKVLADVPDGSLDLILTDPPYPEEFLSLWQDLAEFAQAKLKPSGLLAAMSGQVHLPAVMNMLGSRLTYRWVMAYLMPGQANVVHARKVSTQWKPVLVYGPSERRIHDVVDSNAGDKAHHAWGQSESGMLALLRQLADPGMSICDPFVGGGTTPLVAVAHGCSFIGAEINPAAYETALVRLTA